MPNMPAANEAADTAHRLPRLGIGVHLNLFKSKPLSEDNNVKVLLDVAGNFKYSTSTLAIMASSFHHIRKAIRTEMAAQIQWLIDNDIHPTHIDSHKHIHACPPIFSIVCSLARHFKIKAVRWFYEPSSVTASPWPVLTVNSKRTASILRMMSKFCKRQGLDLIKTQGLLGISHLGHIDTSFLKAVSLYNHLQTAEIMTHPSTEDDPSIPNTPSKPNPKLELEALCDERTKNYFRQADIELINYSQL